jgi:heme/copper-type cytochrome/quinol oxidase subunit 2
MDDAVQTVNVGLAGSITMILLVTAVTVLMISFYRRYKRAAEKQNPEQK